MAIKEKRGLNVIITITNMTLVFAIYPYIYMNHSLNPEQSSLRD